MQVELLLSSLGPRRDPGHKNRFQQLGPEPLDAYRKHLRERQAAGDFTIHQEAFAGEFWRYFTSDSMHEFYERGSEEEAQAFSIPPWEARLRLRSRVAIPPLAPGDSLVRRAVADGCSTFVEPRQEKEYEFFRKDSRQARLVAS